VVSLKVGSHYFHPQDCETDVSFLSASVRLPGTNTIRWAFYFTVWSVLIWHLVDSGLLSGPWGTWAVPVMAHHLRVPYVYSSMNFPWTLLTHTVSGLTHMIVATLAHYLIKLTPALKHQSGLYKMATHITMMYSYVLLIRLWVPESGLISVPSKSYQPGQRLCKFLGWFFFRFPLKYKTAYHLSFCVPSGVYLSWRVSSGSDEEWW